jgi:hypothetical protein
MMKRRNLKAAGIGVACILVAVTVIATLPEPAVTKAKFERIRTGMTMEEVVAAIELPPTCRLGIQKNNKGGSIEFDLWFNPDGSGFEVSIDDEKGVCDKAWYDSTETTREKLRRLVHWPWW